MSTDPASTGWHLDRRVPLALIFTLFIQTGGAIWWASGITAAQEAVVKSQVGLTTRVERLEAGRDEQSSRMVRVETQIGNVSDQVKDQRDLLLQILQELRVRAGSP